MFFIKQVKLTVDSFVKLKNSVLASSFAKSIHADVCETIPRKLTRFGASWNIHTIVYKLVMIKQNELEANYSTIDPELNKNPLKHFIKYARHFECKVQLQVQLIRFFVRSFVSQFINRSVSYN